MDGLANSVALAAAVPGAASEEVVQLVQPHLFGAGAPDEQFLFDVLNPDWSAAADAANQLLAVDGLIGQLPGIVPPMMPNLVPTTDPYYGRRRGAAGATGNPVRIAPRDPNAWPPARSRKVPIRRIAAPVCSTPPNTEMDEQRRTARTLSDRRYRNTMQHRINTLYSVLPPELIVDTEDPTWHAATAFSGKLLPRRISKEALLGRAADYIVLLRAQIDRYREDCESLRTQLISVGITPQTPSGSVDGSDLGHIATAQDHGVPSATAGAEHAAESAKSDSSDKSSADDSDSSHTGNNVSHAESGPTAKRMRQSSTSSSETPVSPSSTATVPQQVPPSVSAAAPSPASKRAGTTLFALLLGLMLFNPASMLGTAVQRAEVAGDRSTGRALASVLPADMADAVWLQQMILNAVWWLLRAVLAALLVVRALASEPVAQRASGRYRAAVLSEKQAEAAVRHGDADAARRHLDGALHALGHTPPASRSVLVRALSWQALRQLLHRLWIGQWLDEVLARRSDDAAACYAAGMRIHYRLHELTLFCVSGSHEAASRAQQLHWALTAVNLAEAAGDRTDPGTMANAYIALAAAIRVGLPRALAPLALIYLTRARGVDSRAEHGWLSAHGAQAYVASGDWPSLLRRFRSTDWCPVAMDASAAPPTADGWRTARTLGACYRLHQMQAAFRMMARADATGAAAQFRSLQSLCAAAGDDRALWWACTGLAFAQWRLGCTSDARRSFEAAEAAWADGHATDRARGRPCPDASDALQAGLRAAGVARLLWAHGDTKRAIAAIGAATALFQADLGRWPRTDREPGSVHAPARLLALQCAIETELAMLAQISVDAGPDATADAQRLSLQLQCSLGHLRTLAADFAPALAPLHRYQAERRRLAHGLDERIELHYRKSLAAARTNGNPYDEAVALLRLYGDACRPAASAECVPLLNRAAHLFASVAAAGELAECRRLLERTKDVASAAS